MLRPDMLAVVVLMVLPFLSGCAVSEDMIENKEFTALVFIRVYELLAV